MEIIKKVLAQAEVIHIDKPNEVQVTQLGPLIKAGISVAIILAAILTFAYLVWGGLQWITSGGDKSKYEEARNKITAALIGLAIVALAWLTIKLVAYFFGIPDPFDRSWTLPKAF
ncbi:MAG: pilin [Candidatus Omnitrophica bacterium]|nr:pilin [Candidatus Omnitrophota bacterium]